MKPGDRIPLIPRYLFKRSARYALSERLNVGGTLRTDGQTGSGAVNGRRGASLGETFVAPARPVPPGSA